MKKEDDLLSQLRMEELEKYNVSFNHETAYTLRIYSKLKSIIEDTLDIQHYYDFHREGDMKNNLTIEVYHLCEALELAKRELIDFAIENGYDGLIKPKKL
ncbi:hypothetical protein N9N57_00555 [Flavobacteriaceae bacterium]|jgi:pyruvate-formate lyase-activating enzyme|nr:hypothetical protein [Flavobacteriaceae bacterium]